MIKSHTYRTLALLALGACITGIALAQSLGPPTYELSWNTIDSGGGNSTGGGYQLTGTIGQPDASTVPLAGGAYTIAGGFWPGAGQQPGQTCEGDADNSGAVDVDDLIAIILGWGGCLGCPPNHCASDVAPHPNGNCATDVDDLISVILHWGACP
jgi:hypothetical protein